MGCCGSVMSPGDEPLESPVTVHTPASSGTPTAVAKATDEVPDDSSQQKDLREKDEVISTISNGKLANETQGNEDRGPEALLNDALGSPGKRDSRPASGRSDKSFESKRSHGSAKSSRSSGSVKRESPVSQVSLPGMIPEDDAEESPSGDQDKPDEGNAEEAQAQKSPSAKSAKSSSSPPPPNGPAPGESSAKLRTPMSSAGRSSKESSSFGKSMIQVVSFGDSINVPRSAGVGAEAADETSMKDSEVQETASTSEQNLESSEKEGPVPPVEPEKVTAAESGPSIN
ncbi:serrate RNA effector molecule homolog [Macrobrachium nipponense]|uniref:serrate RNA effector molecule homolog n=1 Tax=Macrobrachium nipponense TaxID=159736 RepID=UPI0030C85A8B